MKKLCVLFLGIVMCASLFAQLNITSTSVTVNGTSYNCKPDGTFTGDIGSMSTMTLKGSVANTGETSNSSAYMYYRVNNGDNGDWNTVVLNDKKTAIEEGPSPKIIIGPENGTSASEPNALMKTQGTTIETYSRTSSLTVDITGLSNGETPNLDIYFSLSTANDPSDAPDSYYTATFTKIAAIDFTDGSSFSPTVSEGSTDQAIGRFYLNADVSGAELTAASVTLSGIRTGFSNIKLWSSADAVFDGSGTDALLATITEDPGTEPAVFSSISSAISTGGTCYFVTADVAPGATGSIRGTLEDDGDLTVSSGSITQTLSSEPLSSSDLALPIELKYFTAEPKNGAVVLRWQTESETENAAFRIYRDGEIIATMEGAGTTAEPQSYRWTNNYVVPDKTYRYVLADVDLQGKETKHPEVKVKVEVEEATGTNFTIGSAYPNPFNPVTVVPLNLAKDADVHAQLFDLSGRPVQELHSGALTAGSHDLKISGTDLSTGIYFVHINVNNVLNVRKIALMK